MPRLVRTRIAIALLACACLGTAGAVAASAATTASSVSPSKVSVKVTTCTRGQAKVDRMAVFRAGMKTIARASRLSVRFTLQESVAGRRYHRIDAPGLDVWRRSHSGVGAFAYRQRVRGLSEGSSYRVSVRFRWQDASGKVLASAFRRSKACRQGAALPDLAVQRIGARPIDGAATRAQYGITLINRGTMAAPASIVKLLADGDSAGRAVVPALLPGQTAKVLLEAPRCSVNATAVADPDSLVKESDERNNSRTVACPVG